MKTYDTDTNDTFPDTLLLFIVFSVMAFIILLVGSEIRNSIDNLSKSISKLPIEFIEKKEIGKFKDIKIFIKNKEE